MRNSSDRKNPHTAAIAFLLLFFLSATACFAFFVTGASSGVQSSLTGSSGGALTIAAKANMRTGEWVALVAVVTVGALAFLALLLFMLVFPLINRIAGTHIPCFDLFSSEEKPRKKKTATCERTTKSAEKSEGYADDRYVKTVRIDTLYHPEEEKEITASAIDRAVRQAARKSNGKKKK